MLSRRFHDRGFHRSTGDFAEYVGGGLTGCLDASGS